MFYLNLGYKWHYEGMKKPGTGAVILASGNAAHRLHPSRIPGDLGALLLDPQLYLAGLDSGRCAPTCARLATHKWFGVDGLPDLQPGEAGSRAKLRNIEASIGAHWPAQVPLDSNEIDASALLALLAQHELGCSMLLAPSPLVGPGPSHLSTFDAWLESGIGAWRDLDAGQPLLATIAILDTALDEAAFGPTGLLESVVDLVSAREELGGAYVVIAQTTARHPFESQSAVVAAYLRLCKRLRECGVGIVVTNFCDLIGISCLALGATSSASGPSQSVRRLALAGFEDREGGGPLPAVYCHSSAAEFLTEDDIDAWKSKRFLRRVFDRTKYSESLYAAIAAGRPVASLPDWVQSKNNVTAAQHHYVERISTEVVRLSELPEKRRLEQVEDWLETADQNQLYLEERLNVEVKGTKAPVVEWSRLLENEA